MVNNYSDKGVNYMYNADYSTPPEGVVAVDLGLPSGTKWANMNVGATKPQDFGLYFAWGETVGYSSGSHRFDGRNYKWCYGDLSRLKKYSNDRFFHLVDNKTVLDLEDDAAYVNWGSNWRMPTKEQLTELFRKTKKEWIEIDGIYGYKFTSMINSNYIFLPATGFYRNERLWMNNSEGRYWSLSLDKRQPDQAYVLRIYQGLTLIDCSGRNDGLTIRPVLNK